MIEAIFSAIGTAITSFAGVIGNGFESMVSLFYTAGSNGAAGSLTTLGTLSLVGAGVGLVYWAFHIIRSLIRVRP